jgi:hypothetical protein
MKRDTFLENVAADIINKYGTDLTRIAVVFPNKRASLFLNSSLARIAAKPIWSPAYITISDLFRTHSSLVVGDPIKLVCDLYKVYIRITDSDETLDRFFSWGQLMISDFDDIDKNMADADRIFTNVSDLHEMDDNTFLNEDQKEMLQQFFGNVIADSSVLKERFLHLWNNLAHIYHAYNEKLWSEGIAYEGGLYRSVITEQNIDFKYDTYLFVGFNVLQKVEQILFRRLLTMGKAKFYWDFDHYYMEGDHEAGRYVKQYLSLFPNEFDNNDQSLYNNFSSDKEISYISATTENIQARYVSNWLTENRISPNNKTAIVMCNENILPTITYSLPDSVKDVNITTGFPFSQSPVSSLLIQMLALQNNGFTADGNLRKRFAMALLRHPYSQYISKNSAKQLEEFSTTNVFIINKKDLIDDKDISYLFTLQTTLKERTHWIIDILDTIASNYEGNDPLFQESLYRAYTMINRLMTLIDADDLDVDFITFERLLNQVISTTTIPFHGEPAIGLQVMGVLETRNLDFDNILILSANEGMMPKGVNDTSFIPYAIRKSYGLTTIDNKVAIYAYYFYSMLQRAKNITILFNNSTEGAKRGEMSRFMLQMLVESGHKINHYSLSAGQHHENHVTEFVEKKSEIMEILYQKFDIQRNHRNTALLTPTTINKYLKCQLSFFYKYICDIDEPDDIEEGDVDARTFGNIFHFIAEGIYKPIIQRGGKVTSDLLNNYLKNPAMLKRIIDQAFCRELFKITDSSKPMPKLNGTQLINYNVITTYVRNLLSYDKSNSPFDIIDLEKDISKMIHVRSTKEFETTIGGRIDRLDCKNEKIRVIDYKTGSKIALVKDIDDIFIANNNHTDYYLQTFLYSEIVRCDKQLNPKDLPVSPALLFIQHLSLKDYDPILKIGEDKITDIRMFQESYDRELLQVINDIFDQSKPFSATLIEKNCLFCPYQKLCGHH